MRERIPVSQPINTVSTGTWVRLTVHTDYINKIWDLYIDGLQVTNGLDFCDPAASTYELFGLLDGRGGSTVVGTSPFIIHLGRGRNGRLMVSLVMTVIAPDRPGLVEALAATVASHQGNWVESRMAHLAGQFAGILHIEVADQGGLVESLGKGDWTISAQHDTHRTVGSVEQARVANGPTRPSLEVHRADRRGTP